MFATTLPTDHPTALVYLDETGWVSRDRFLGVGALKIADPHDLRRRLTSLRSQHGSQAQLHWAQVPKSGPQMQALVESALRLVCEDVDCYFACAIVDREKVDFNMTYGTVWQAYVRLASRALRDLLTGDEIYAVIADRFDCPPGFDPEGAIRSTVNDAEGRLAIAGVQRVGSAGVDGLQLADILLGAITYQVRQANDRTDGDPIREAVSVKVMTEFYGQKTYVGQGPGRLEINRLTVLAEPWTERRPRRPQHTRWP